MCCRLIVDAHARLLGRKFFPKQYMYERMWNSKKCENMPCKSIAAVQYYLVHGSFVGQLTPSVCRTSLQCQRGNVSFAKDACPRKPKMNLFLDNYETEE